MSASADASLTAKISLKAEGDEILKRLIAELEKLKISVKNLGGNLKELEAVFTKMSSSTGNALNNINNVDSSIRKLTFTSNAVNSSVSQATTSIEKLGSQSLTTKNLVSGLDSTIAQTTVRTGELASKVSQSIQAYSTAAIAIWGLYNAWDNLEKVELQVDRANLALQKSQTRLASIQENLNEGLRTNRLDSTEAAVQNQRLKDATEAVALATEKARLAQEDYTELMTGFATQVLPFVAIAGMSVVQMITTMQTSMVAASGATVTLTMAVRGLGVAMWNLLKNPITIAIVAAITAFTAFQQNLFGVADAINAVGKALGDLVAPLKWVLTKIGEFGDMIRGIQSNTTALSDSINADFGIIKSSAEESLTSIGTGLDNVTGKIKNLREEAKKGLIGAISERKNIMEMPNILPSPIPEGERAKMTEQLHKAFGTTFSVDVELKLKDYKVVDDMKGFYERLKGQAQDTVIGLDDATLSLEKMGVTINELDPLVEKFMRDATDSSKLIVFKADWDKLRESMEFKGTDTEVLDRINKILQFTGQQLVIVDKQFAVVGGSVLDVTGKVSSMGQITQYVAGLWGGQIAALDGYVGGLTDYGKILSEINELTNKKGGEEAKTRAMGLLDEYVGRLSSSLLGLEIDLTASSGSMEGSIDVLKKFELGYTDTVTAVDTGTPLFRNSAKVIGDFAGQSETSIDDVLKMYRAMRTGTQTEIGSMTDFQQDAFNIIVSEINKIPNEVERLATIKEILGGYVIPPFIDTKDAVIEAKNEFPGFAKELENITRIQSSVANTSSEAWKAMRNDIVNATDPEVIQNWISAIDSWIANTDASTDKGKLQIMMLTELKNRLLESKDVLEGSNASNLEYTNTLQALAVQYGVNTEAINDYIDSKGNDKVASDEGISKMEELLNVKSQELSILNDAEEMQRRLNLATYETNRSIEENVAAIMTENAAKESSIPIIEKIIEVTGVEWPAALELTAENLYLVTRAANGDAQAQDALTKAIKSAVASLDPYTQRLVKVHQETLDIAKAVGVENNVLREYQRILNTTNTLTEAQIRDLQKRTNAALNSATATNRLKLTQQEYNNVVSATKSTAADTLKAIQTETIQTATLTRYYVDVLVQAGYKLEELRQLSYNQLQQLVAMQQISANIAQNMMAGFMKEIEMPSGGGGGGGGGGGSQKQEIDKKALREQATQAAIEERAAIDHLVQKLIDETTATHDLALEMGVGIRAMKDYEKATDRFGIATEKATIKLLELTVAESRNMRFLTNSNTQLKDRYRALIDGSTAANDFVREIRMSIIAEREEEEQLLRLTQALGIKLPNALDTSVENLQDLVAAAYGSEEALQALKERTVTGSTEIGDYYRDVIADAKQAITDANFEEFVKKELLFAGVGDEFFRNITREIQSEMKLDQIAEQMRKQLGLIQLNPETFKMGVPEEDIESGILSTIAAIEQAMSGNERLTSVWQPMVDALRSTMSSPDIYAAMQDFADKFPNILEPAVTGLDFALEGLDTQINTTFSDTKNQEIAAQKETVDDLKDSYDDIYDELLDAAKAAQDASDSMSGAADSASDMADAWTDNVGKLLELDEASKTSLGGISTGTQDALASILQLGPGVEGQTSSINTSFGSIPVSVLQYFGTDIPQSVTEGLDKVKNAADLNIMMMKLGFTDFKDTTGAQFKDELPPLVEEGLGKLPPATTVTVGEMDVAMYEFNLNLQRIWNPAVARSVQIGMDMLPPIVQATMTQLTGIFDKGGSDWETSVKTHVDKINKMFESMVDTVKKVVSDINTELSKLKDIERKITYTYETKGSPPKDAAGGAFVVGHETHLTVGEGNRPELVSVTPLSSDYFRNNGLADGGLGLFSSDEKRKLTSDVGRAGGTVLSYSSQQSGGSRPIIINNIIPVSIGNEEVKKVITSETFDGYDEQL